MHAYIVGLYVTGKKKQDNYVWWFS